MGGQRTCLYIDAWDKHTFNIEVYQNTTHHCGASITIASEKGGLLEHVNIYNNIVYQNKSNGLEIGNWGEPGIFVHPIENVHFINNTAYNNGTDGWGGGFFNENPDVSGIVVRNNIFSQNHTSQIINESTASLTVDHNLIDGTQDDENAINDVNFVLGNPLFIRASEANFHLQANSPAIDNGSAVDAPTNDFDGIPRPQDGDEDASAIHDIGAFEKLTYSEIGYLPIVQSD
ncbi:MAG: hypothetical protein DWQ04_34335 [Chloroflexi bacterium]|nr:MAG: hypothetical protein DWQ04_34335 [Chloroflexota bacterium]